MHSLQIRQRASHPANVIPHLSLPKGLDRSVPALSRNVAHTALLAMRAQSQLSAITLFKPCFFKQENMMGRSTPKEKVGVRVIGKVRSQG